MADPGRVAAAVAAAGDPDDVPPIKLSRPIVLFVLIRVIAVSGAAAIAFGLHITNADWMPLATLIALKPTLQQSTLRVSSALSAPHWAPRSPLSSS